MPSFTKKEEIIIINVFLVSLVGILTFIGTVTPHWFGIRVDDKWIGQGTFCRNALTTDKYCLPSSIDALCIISILFLLATLILNVVHIKHMVETETSRFIFAGTTLFTSILLLSIIALIPFPVGFSFQLIVTSCALAQLLLIISGVRLGEILRTEPSEINTNYTSEPLLFITRSLMVLITLFTLIGMSTYHWIGFNLITGWSGGGTFCRQRDSDLKECIVPTATTVLSVLATIFALCTTLSLIYCAYKNIKPQDERYTIPVLVFIVSILLWFTVATTVPSKSTGYSFRLIIATGPFIHLSLVASGTWLGISRNPTESVVRWF